jgi:hypothetical protein
MPGVKHPSDLGIGGRTCQTISARPSKHPVPVAEPSGSLRRVGHTRRDHDPIHDQPKHVRVEPRHKPLGDERAGHEALVDIA